MNKDFSCFILLSAYLIISNQNIHGYHETYKNSTIQLSLLSNVLLGLEPELHNQYLNQYVLDSLASLHRHQYAWYMIMSILNTTACHLVRICEAFGHKLHCICISTDSILGKNLQLFIESTY